MWKANKDNAKIGIEAKKIIFLTIKFLKISVKQNTRERNLKILKNRINLDNIKIKVGSIEI